MHFFLLQVIIYVDDINDNAPILVPQNDPVIMENTPGRMKIVTVFGKDLDSPENGPPFRFSEAQVNSVRHLFDLRYNPGKP